MVRKLGRSRKQMYYVDACVFDFLRHRLRSAGIGSLTAMRKWEEESKERPDRTFHNFRASKSAYRWILHGSETLISGFWGSKFLKMFGWGERAFQTSQVHFQHSMSSRPPIHKFAGRPTDKQTHKQTLKIIQFFFLFFPSRLHRLFYPMHMVSGMWGLL